LLDDKAMRHRFVSSLCLIALSYRFVGFSEG
jgi:hypothetical protein